MHRATINVTLIYLRVSERKYYDIAITGPILGTLNVIQIMQPIN